MTIEVGKIISNDQFAENWTDFYFCTLIVSLNRTYKLPIKILSVNFKNMGPVLNAENIKADTPKILTPTHFSDPKDINAKKWVVGVVP